MSTGATVFKICLCFCFLLLLGNSNLFAQLQVEKIIFQGNNTFKNSDLKAILKSKEKKEFDAKLYRIDKIILKNYYSSRGFLNVWIEGEVDRRGEKVDVVFQISEGIRFVLGEIRFSGAQIISSAQLREFFPIKDGEFFQMTAIENGLNTLENYYFNNGKPYIEIKEQQTTRDSLIDVHIEIKENETVYIHEIQYRGLKQVREFVVARELVIRQNEMYSRRNIEKSQRNIYSTGLFDFVGVELKALDSTRTRAFLLIKVMEKKNRWIGVRFGVGYEQEIVYGGTFDFTFEFGHRNLFGTARSLYGSVVPSFSYDFDEKQLYNPKNQYSLNYVEPWIGYSRTPGIFRLAFTQVRPLNSAKYDYFTSAFMIQHEFENYYKASGTLAYNRVQILEGDSLNTEFYELTRGQDYIYSITPNVKRDRRDNFLNPQDGSLMDLTVRFAFSRTRDNTTGEKANNRFIKTSFEWNRYQRFKFVSKWILASRIKIGNIFMLEQNSVVPVSERFYLGGASTVRGYPEQLLGPLVFDQQGNPKALGGQFMVLANAEFRIPLIWLLWGELFFDAGNIWLQKEDFNFSGIRTTSGAGLAFLTPLGPIRLDYGIKFQPEVYESAGEFHISIAFAF